MMMIKQRHVFAYCQFKWKRLSHFSYSNWSLDDMMLDLSLTNTVWNKVVARKMKCQSAFGALCHMALPQTHPLWEHWRLVAPRGRLSANLFCAVNNDERAWALFTSIAQAVIVRSTRSLANVCVSAVPEDEEGWLAAGQAAHKTQVWRQSKSERERVGRSLAEPFITGP